MGRLSRYLRFRFGLRARMTASYVLVTAAAVILVEAIAIAFTIPSLLASQDLITRVSYTASAYADAASTASSSSTQLVLPADYQLGQKDASLGPGRVRSQGYGLEIPQFASAFPDSAPPLSMALVFSSDGHVLASSYPARYPIGSSAFSAIPDGLKGAFYGSNGQISDVANGQVAWVVEAVVQPSGKPLGSEKNVEAYVYVQAPVQGQTIASFAAAEPLLLPGLVVLLLALPVGTVFGLLTTRGVVRRLRRLAGTTATFAEGDFTQRVASGAHDEVGSLERNFNEMAARLEAAIARERLLAEKSARLAERGRISRELHDSISQDLFSLSLLAAGLERALPSDSALLGEVRTLAETVQSTTREMRALLLELRPTTLDEKGLLPALQELASNYSTRLGIRVDAELEPVNMAPPAELAALRIAQEGLANAIKHAHANTIRLAVHRHGAFVEITVSDDGRGFNPNGKGGDHGLGLRMMRERVGELGGSLTIISGEGEGTTLSANLPVAAA
jgi:signal transduction histidine kinase